VPDDVPVLNCAHCGSSLAVEVSGGAVYARLREDVGAVRKYTERAAMEAELRRLEERDLPAALLGMEQAQDKLGHAWEAVADERDRVARVASARASFRIFISLGFFGFGAVVGSCGGLVVAESVPSVGSDYHVLFALVVALVLGLGLAAPTWLVARGGEVDSTEDRLEAKAQIEAKVVNRALQHVSSLKARITELRSALDAPP